VRARWQPEEDRMISLSVSVDVPDLADAIRFYTSAFGFSKASEPVHLDIHVEDLEAALAQVLDAGATGEQVFENPEHGSVALCSDPFGHGFCLIERKR
jgi:predicted enzyme related to lactoylglutathione lyase